MDNVFESGTDFRNQTDGSLIQDQEHIDGFNDSGDDEESVAKTRQGSTNQRPHLSMPLPPGEGSVLFSNSSALHSSFRRNSFNAGPKVLEDLADLHGLQDLEASAYDKASTQQITLLHNQIAKIFRDLGRLEGGIEYVQAGENVISRIQPTLERHADQLRINNERFVELHDKLADLEQALLGYAAAAQVKHVNIKRDIERFEATLVGAVEEHADALTSKATAQGEVAAAIAQEAVDAQQKIIFDSARAILRLRVQENRGLEPSPLLEKKIADLQIQLRETARKQREANPASTWSLTNPWATEQDVQKARNSRALRSVEKLANNPAFTNLKNIKNAGDLSINEKLLDLMNISLFALFNFNKASTTLVSGSPSQQGTSTSSIAESTQLLSTPSRTKLGSALATQSPARATKVDNADIVNQAVIDVMRHDLAEIQKEAGGLIGSPNPNRQFWGKVLMVLALAIATMISAVLIMSMLGVASPTFLVPYLAAIQSSSMVSTVLNFVAAKLAVDLNTAAVVTAVATAGTFGLFGKVTHASGAPTSLKSDLDRAAQDMEAALKETDAARSSISPR